MSNKDIPVESLIPPTALRKSLYSSYSEKLDYLFVKGDWSAKHLRRQYDAVYIGLYIADKIVHDDYIRAHTDLEKIGKIIVCIRNDNWKAVLQEFGHFW
jgi:hypothetical protein